jgi:hypothetical protein|tara:strand:- start:77 stop:271 length:195 start_codon:yes stop_codon:yes gene_type:complete
MTCLLTSADNAQALLLEAISELDAPDKFDGFSEELQQKTQELSGELKAIHGAIEDLYTLAQVEN